MSKPAYFPADKDATMVEFYDAGGLVQISADGTVVHYTSDDAGNAKKHTDRTGKRVPLGHFAADALVASGTLSTKQHGASSPSAAHAATTDLPTKANAQQDDATAVTPSKGD